MTITRGSLASFKARARDGLEQELGLSVVLNEDATGRVIRQSVTINLDGAWLELVKTLLDDLNTGVTNATFRNQLATARASLGI